MEIMRFIAAGRKGKENVHKRMCNKMMMMKIDSETMNKALVMPTELPRAKWNVQNNTILVPNQSF